MQCRIRRQKLSFHDPKACHEEVMRKPMTPFMSIKCKMLIYQINEAVEESGFADEVSRRGVADASAEEDDDLEDEVIFGVERGRQLLLHPRNLKKIFVAFCHTIM